MRQWIQLLLGPSPDTDWEWHETSSGPVMRRRVNGQFEARQMTPEEMRDYMYSRCGW